MAPQDATVESGTLDGAQADVYATSAVSSLVPMIEGHDAEVNAIVAGLVQAGLLTVGTDADGRETRTLTEQGEQVANQIAMSAEDDGVALLTALLAAGG